ncbi:MAG: hypothetical protein AB3N10_08265, partial [Allomuricauda sp.]
MSDVGALLRYLKKRDKGAEILIEGNTYTSEQIKLAQQLLMDAQKELDQSRKKPKLSRRRAFIVILEELYYDVPKYPSGTTLDYIHKKASQRFEYAQRSMSNFNSPSDVHPKNPCQYYKKNGLKMGNYKVALSHLVT